MARIDIGPTQGPELQALADIIVATGDPYIESVRSAKPLMLLGLSSDISTQALSLNDAAKEANINGAAIQESLFKKLDKYKEEIVMKPAGQGEDEAATASRELQERGIEADSIGVTEQRKREQILTEAVDKRMGVLRSIETSQKGFDRTIGELDRLQAGLGTGVTPVKQRLTDMAMGKIKEQIIDAGGELPARHRSHTPQDTAGARRRQESQAKPAAPALTEAEREKDNAAWLEGAQLGGLSKTGGKKTGGKKKGKGKSSNKKNTPSTSAQNKATTRTTETKVQPTPTQGKTSTTSAAEAKGQSTHPQNKTTTTGTEETKGQPAPAQDKTTTTGTAEAKVQPVPAQDKTITTGTEETKGQATSDNASTTVGNKETQRSTQATSKQPTKARQQTTNNNADTKLEQSFIPGKTIGKVSSTGGIHAWQTHLKAA